MPSGDVAKTLVFWSVAQKSDPFHAMAVQVPLAGRVRAVHVTPSGEVAALVPSPIAQNTLPFQATEAQPAGDGMFALVTHVIPSEEVATDFEP